MNKNIEQKKIEFIFMFCEIIFLMRQNLYKYNDKYQRLQPIDQTKIYLNFASETPQ